MKFAMKKVIFLILFILMATASHSWAGVGGGGAADLLGNTTYKANEAPTASSRVVTEVKCHDGYGKVLSKGDADYENCLTAASDTVKKAYPSKVKPSPAAAAAATYNINVKK